MSTGVVMLDLAGTSLSEMDRKRLLHPLTGGVILFSRNYVSPEQLCQLTTEIRALREPPLLIAVDQEGGRVQRFQTGFTRLPAMRRFGECWDNNPRQARQLAWQAGYVLAAELKACGIDISFMPVLDLDYGLGCVIGDRSLHRNPQAVAELAHELMLGMRHAGMVAVGKHFPGHGAIAADTHVEIAVDTRDFVDIEMEDLLPFQRMVHFGLTGMMAAHVIYSSVDHYPAGFSRKWLQDVLRHTLGFDGCLFSDDLSMHATSSYGDIVQRARLALQAGCDMVLVCNDTVATGQLLDGLSWEISATGIARLARMRGRRAHHSLQPLREIPQFINAVDAINNMLNQQC
ncbi:MAG: beta-N-acetylhexosaminidase [Nitrosomonas sp.]|nr:beta-N-acetylhexosaminidase [Nitrosomonas sp.]